MKIVGVVGFIDSGKGTVGDILVNEFGYKQDSWANPLKDAVAAVFGWDRELLEGVTSESRAWREERDEWWSDRLKMDITPRWVLQYVGTDVFRNNFHSEIWVASLENRVRKSKLDIVITDCRFFNEVDAIRDIGGTVIRVRRGPEPHWWFLGESANLGDKSCTAWAGSIKQSAIKELADLKIHASEYSWIGAKFDVIIENDGTLDDLKEKVRTLEQIF